jgi:putative FmdB family regulatory protein
MPIYEYTCDSCMARVSLFFRSYAAVEEQPQCPRCGERRLSRRASRSWSRSRTSSNPSVDEAAMEPGWASPMADWDDPFAAESSFEEDFEPAEFARQARQMAAMTGEPLDHEFDQALHLIESGADPDEVLGEMDAREAEAGGTADESIGT